MENIIYSKNKLLKIIYANKGKASKIKISFKDAQSGRIDPLLSINGQH